jgi:hypothetical protein
MSKVNTYGMKMKGLKKASGDTCDYDNGGYIQISYDVVTGEILTDFHCDLGGNSYTRYHDKAVLGVCTTGCHMTMQEIADAIYRKIYYNL